MKSAVLGTVSLLIYTFCVVLLEASPLSTNIRKPHQTTKPDAEDPVGSLTDYKVRSDPRDVITIVVPILEDTSVKHRKRPLEIGNYDPQWAYTPFPDPLATALFPSVQDRDDYDEEVPPSLRTAVSDVLKAFENDVSPGARVQPGWGFAETYSTTEVRDRDENFGPSNLPQIWPPPPASAPFYPFPLWQSSFPQTFTPQQPSNFWSGNSAPPLVNYPMFPNYYQAQLPSQPFGSPLPPPLMPSGSSSAYLPTNNYGSVQVSFSQFQYGGPGQFPALQQDGSSDHSLVNESPSSKLPEPLLKSQEPSLNTQDSSLKSQEGQQRNTDQQKDSVNEQKPSDFKQASEVFPVKAAVAGEMANRALYPSANFGEYEIPREPSLTISPNAGYQSYAPSSWLNQEFSPPPFPFFSVSSQYSSPFPVSSPFAAPPMQFPQFGPQLSAPF